MLRTVIKKWSGKIVVVRVLILGGSWFLGRRLAADALARGWRVTAFTRGRSGSLPDGVEHIRGDRTVEDDLVRLATHGAWDATVDTSAFEPPDVLRVLAALGEGAGHYVLLSTVSAYRDWPSEPVDETSALWPSRPDFTEVSPELAQMSEPFRYGTLKAGCELAASQAAKSLLLRPGVILGPGEYVGRGLKLLERAERGGSWLVPGPPDQPIQPVDVRDVSAFTLDAIEAGLHGAYNLTAPPGFATYGDLVKICIELTGNRVTPVWVDPGWLMDQGVQQWTEIPLWRTPPGTWAVSGQQAAAAGFTCRPLRATLADFQIALRHEPLVPHPRQDEHGLAAEREAELLKAWEGHSR